MKISTKGRYALEALTYMASLKSNLPLTAKTLADAVNLPEAYLEQIFFVLRKAKILETKRGSDGGYYIVRDIKRLTAGEIIRTLENKTEMVACLNNRENCKSGIYDNCTTRLFWNKISDTVNDVLDNITVYELSEEYKKMAEAL